MRCFLTTWKLPLRGYSNSWIKGMGIVNWFGVYLQHSLYTLKFQCIQLKFYVMTFYSFPLSLSFCLIKNILLLSTTQVDIRNEKKDIFSYVLRVLHMKQWRNHVPFSPNPLNLFCFICRSRIFCMLSSPNFCLMACPVFISIDNDKDEMVHKIKTQLFQSKPQ